MKNLQAQINLIYNQQKSDLDIGIYKCINGQKNHNRISNIKHLYNINDATLYSDKKTGLPILLIPSHINRGYIMDIMPEHSFISKLESHGISPYLLEWNDPSHAIMHYSESDYIENILIPMIDYISELHNSKIIVLGHCLGGLMALAATQIRHDKIAGLITIATPWDFHESSFIYKTTNDIYNLMLHNSNSAYIPKELIHTMMNWPHLNTTIRKLISISRSQQIDEIFFAVENWLDDNVNMTIPFFKSCMNHAIHNQTYNSEWRVLGEIINPKKISIPTLNIIPIKDKVVPRGSSEPLSRLFKNCQTLHIDTGHIGMLISRNHNFSYIISEWIKYKTI